MRGSRSVFGSSASSSLLLLLLLLLLVLHSEPAIQSELHAPDPNDEAGLNAWVQRDAEVRQKLADQMPVGVLKLSDDEGEKFWLQYWQFLDEDEDDDDITPAGTRDGEENRLASRWEVGARRWNAAGNFSGNASMLLLRAPYALHAHEHEDESFASTTIFRPLRWLPRGRLPALAKRNFECPVGSTACTSIGRPNSCCKEGSVCQIIEDTGLGDVGCCPSDSETCTGDLRSCPEGHTSCPGSLGGGCCIPGYSCFNEGCISTVTKIVTPTGSSSETWTSASPPPSTPTRSPPDTPTIDPPWRPTSNPDTRTTSTPTPTSTSTTETTTEPPQPTHIGCPTGFYPCSAHYLGGCCRTGRDCNLTGCPAPSMTTVVDSNGVTIVVPRSTDASWLGSGPTGRCAEGWTSCGADVGGGCCPNGYECGWTSCTASTAVGTGSVGKIPPENKGGKGRVAEWKHASLTWMVMILWHLVGW
ncbi:hypothetical protein VTO42DRAFT_7895 [Malbranchea cinnamomea]